VIKLQLFPTYIDSYNNKLLLQLIIIIMLLFLSSLFYPILLLSQNVTPTAQASSFRLQYLPYYRMFSLYAFVTISVAQIITDMIIHLIYHIRCTSVHKLLYFSFFSN
jgi:hypothetical protein